MVSLLLSLHEVMSATGRDLKSGQDTTSVFSSLYSCYYTCSTLIAFVELMAELHLREDELGKSSVSGPEMHFHPILHLKM